MKRTLLVLSFAIVLSAAGVPDAAAQFLIGPRGGYNLDAEEAFIGAEVRYPLTVGAYPIVIAPAIDYYFTDNEVADDLGLDINTTFLQLDVNAIYSFGIDNEAFTPFAGAGLGLGYARISGDDVEDSESETDIGANIVGGAYFGSGQLRPFAQARITFADGTAASLMGGVLFQLGN